LRELQLEPVHAPLRALFEDGHVGAVLGGSATDADLDALEDRLAAFLVAVGAATSVRGDPIEVAARIRDEATVAYRDAAAGLSPHDRGALLGWLVLSRLGSMAPGADVAATSLAWFDELRLAPVVANGFRTAGLPEAESWTVADLVRVLLALPRPSAVRGRGRAVDLRLVERWLAHGPVRAAMGVNTWEGVEWLDRDRFVALLGWAVRLDAIETGRKPDMALVRRLTTAAEGAGYRVDALLTALAKEVSRTGPGATGRSAEPRDG
jgi:hypothetical protein